MAIPTADSVPLTGDPRIDGLLTGHEWTFVGPQVLTWSLHDLSGQLSDPPELAAFNAAIASWEAVANVDFQFVGNDPADPFYGSTADLALVAAGNMQDYGLLGFAEFPIPDDPGFIDFLDFELNLSLTPSNYPNPAGDVFINDQDSLMDFSVGALGPSVIIHELGHALGLKHPHDDGGNGRPTFGQLGLADKDSTLWTIMSYNDLNLTVEPSTPMPLDILAIQHLYGPNMLTHPLDDTYHLIDYEGMVQTIWDAGGNDTLDASGLSRGMTIDIRDAGFNDFSDPGVTPFGPPSTISITAIAYGANIENAIGTGFDDTIFGNDLNNHLDGGDGNDVIYGGAGGDKLYGGAGNDTLYGGTGGDALYGGPGDDVFLIKDDGGDVAFEGANQGTDEIRSVNNTTLRDNLENLTLIGTGDVFGEGNAADNVIIGNAGMNTLFGLGGNDTLDGGGGSDILFGGYGDDTYITDGLDTLYEYALSGTDSVESSGTFSLPSGFENLTLTGTGNVNGSGTDGPNQLIGNSGGNKLFGFGGDDTLDGGAGNDTLDGGTGNDTLTGGTGNDTFLVDSLSDVVKEKLNEGTDTVRSTLSYSLAALPFVENLTLLGTATTGTGNAFANVLVGDTMNNTLTGAAGNDTLNGGQGDDTLNGGAGDDLYIVDTAGDVIVDSGGTDSVQSSASYSLAAFAGIENLTLTGSANINATGNALNNVLTGNAGNNTLDGGAGNDTLIGGNGDDIYVVDGSGDVVTETGTGTDTVQSAIGYSLASLASVENLTLGGSANINATGNGLNNVLTGNTGNNTLTGGAGNDTLVGGTGNDKLIGGAGTDSMNGGDGKDTFVFDVSLSSGKVDTITGFSHPNDTINLDHSFFTALVTTGGHTLATGEFAANSKGIATQADDRIIYNTSNGSLFYDSDGNGPHAAVKFAVLSGHPTLDHTDFFITT